MEPQENQRVVSIDDERTRRRITLLVRDEDLRLPLPQLLNRYFMPAVATLWVDERA